MEIQFYNIIQNLSLLSVKINYHDIAIKFKIKLNLTCLYK